MAASTSARRASSAVSSATSCCRVEPSWTRSSASSRTPGVAHVGLDDGGLARRLRLPAERPSWRRISVVRSWTRVRLASIASSLRSARSLRLRCLRTPAASSMKPRRSSGVARRTVSSWPCPTMTCISRPMPLSDSSSWTSSSRQLVPLIAYSEPPLRNIVREIVTSV